MDDLQKLSDAELQAELKRREEEQRQSSKPQMLQNPDYENLKALGQEYIDMLFIEGREIKDASHWFCETTMTTLFGKDVWDWINKQLG